jgi:hypothetical protein
MIYNFFKNTPPRYTENALFELVAELIREQKTQNYLKFYNIDWTKSIIFDFTGGIGDQFFCFCFAYKFYKEYKNDKGYKIYFNTNSGRMEHGGFKLLNFNIRKYINFEAIRLPMEIQKIYSDTGNYSCAYFGGLRDQGKPLLTEPELNKYIVDDIQSVQPPIIIKRFYHPCDVNGDILEKYADDLRDMMTLITPMDDANREKLEKIKSCKNSICIHLRRGDVVRNKTKGYTPTINYVNKSIREIIEILKNRGETKFNFFIFSNDDEGINWAKNNLDFNVERTAIDADFVDINDNTKSEFELELTKNCKHYILSGGGFSSLMVLLNTNPDKIVIRPEEGDLEY